MWAWLKKAIGGATGLCVPDASQNVTPTPPMARGNDSSSFLGAHASSQERSNSSKQSFAGSAQDDLQDHTPLPLAISNGRAEADLQQQQAAGKDTRTEEDQTPSMQMMPSADRYIVSGGMPVGIANTVSKYRESQPLVHHLTPFEQRVAAKLTEEQQVAAAAAAAAASGGLQDGSIKQKLFAAGDGNGRDVDAA